MLLKINLWVCEGETLGIFGIRMALFGEWEMRLSEGLSHVPYDSRTDLLLIQTDLPVGSTHSNEVKGEMAA